MHIREIRHMSRDDVSELMWKWRCKIFPKKDNLANKKVNMDIKEKDDTKTTGNGKDPTFGAEAVVKTMYEGKNANACDFDWVDYPPKQISKSAARVQDRVAIKVYKIKDRDKTGIAGRFPLMYQKIEVQNPLLVAALEPIVKKENVLLDVNETAEFTAPFRAIWFCQEEIIELCKMTDAADPLKPHLQLLLRVMDEMFAEMRVKRRNLLESNLVDFKSAWTLFPRGSTAYSYGLNSEFLCKVSNTQYVRLKEGMQLIIRAKIMVFNGERFIWQDKTLSIHTFEGNKTIRELSHYPLKFHPHSNEITNRLAIRGKKVLDLQGLEYSCYKGIALHSNAKDEMERHNVESRILIDVLGYNKHHLAQGKRERKDPETKRNRSWEPPPRWDDESDSDSDSDSDDSSETDTEQVGGSWAARSSCKRLSKKEQMSNKKHMLAREDDLAFMSGMLGGYALKNKLWVQFYIEDIKPMVWNDKAFDHLVYDEQQKDLVLSFVENHSSSRSSSATKTTSTSLTTSKGNTAAPVEDVILGKGQGLIILLSGPPGTGKTLTAEAVADRTQRPLFYLQAEDLGINAAQLGANIKRVFEMATEWDAVILLDEADVFMSERFQNDIHRNELVSIFLRELEYFRGIIFLTTNLYNNIDTAFRSRVSLHLLFQELSRDARETVWKKFLQRLPEPIASVEEVDDKGKAVELDSPTPVERPLNDDDIRELSLWKLNGREIKNAVRMVRSWCDHKGYVMTLERLESGIRVTSPHGTKDGDVDEGLYD